MAFPSIHHLKEGYTVERAYDPTIRSRSEGGYVKTRARYSRVPLKWTVYYLITSAEKTTLTSFEDSVLVGSDSFLWTDPSTNTSATVRFSEPISYEPVSSKWKAKIVVEQV